MRLAFMFGRGFVGLDSPTGRSRIGLRVVNIGDRTDPDGALRAGKFTTAVKMALSVKMAGGV